MLIYITLNITANGIKLCYSDPNIIFIFNAPIQYYLQTVFTIKISDENFQYKKIISNELDKTRRLLNSIIIN